MKRTKIILRITLLAIGLASFAFIPWDILFLWMKPLPETVQEQVQDAVNHDLDGIIVYIDKAGKTPEFYASGWNNRENQVPADPHSLFKIASISKLYMATAVAKLVYTDSLDLDKTLADYLPYLANRIEYANQITLKMMVQHRSGIPNYSHHPDFPWDHPPTNKEALALVLDTQADFNPGAKYRYSNTNYLLLGAIMDSTLGYSHHDYIRQEILEPLDLMNTYSLLSEVDINEVMSGYFIGYEPDIKYNDFVNPGGSMVATADDVGIFLRALNDGSLLNNEEQAIYTSLYEFGHTGLLPGYQSIARYHKDIDAVVVQFVNTNGGNAWSISEIIYNRIIKILKS
jgi:D-alanyl-D-alanine carboxypeptidase